MNRGSSSARSCSVPGAVGMLTTMLLRLEGVDVTVASLEERGAAVEALGARYVSIAAGELSELGRLRPRRRGAPATRSSPPTHSACSRRSGVACLIGIDGRDQAVQLDGRVLSLDFVLGNRVVFGSVNAHRQDWQAAVEALDRARAGFADVLEQFVSFRVPLDRFDEAFEHRGGKATLVLDA